MATLQQLELALFQFINQKAVYPGLDPLMRLLSSEVLWVMVALIVSAWGFISKKKGFAKAFWALVAAVALADSIAYRLLKPIIDRDRPCYSHEVRLVADSCGSSFGFPSNHAANGMAVVTMVYLFHRRRRLALALLALVFLVGYSRIYLGVHYPGDILVGYLLGGLISLLLYGGLLCFGKQRATRAHR